MNRTLIVPGLSFPLFPMRPTKGQELTASKITELMTRMKNGDVVQRKLNGDRAVLAVINGQVQIINRRAEQFRHPALNAKDFTHVSKLMVLDGEVYKSKFYPFEALCVDGFSLLDQGPDVRQAAAVKISGQLGLPWMFSVTEDWLLGELLTEHTLRSEFEGVVLKRKGTPYRPLGSPEQDSSDWFKFKYRVIAN